MRGLSRTELELLASQDPDICLATPELSCEPYAVDELVVLAALATRRLTTSYVCPNCAQLALEFGRDEDDDLTHWRLTDAGRLAVRLARSLG